MPSPHTAVAAHSPYVSVIFRETTKRGLSRSPLPSPKRPLYRIAILETAQGQADRALRRGPPREDQSTQKVLTPTDVRELAHSDENRSSRHLSSTPKSSVTFLVLEGGLMSQERPTSNPNAERPDGSIHVFPSTLQPVGQAPHTPTEEASTMLPIPNHYWRLFNDLRLTLPDPGLSPITPGLGPPIVTTETFLGLTQQV
ncbi:hypothetical protein B296_00041595 [Ensete ventricosum]|uniref:Uncharacterized protein n=1 Tax=Ensete ventricosum TaxID=4639 RepID=A0A426XLG3_ENSVE|nr:hypothetical protein B296_00041595 [Ensete ventricosum]